MKQAGEMHKVFLEGYATKIHADLETVFYAMALFGQVWMWPSMTAVKVSHHPLGRPVSGACPWVECLTYKLLLNSSDVLHT